MDSEKLPQLVERIRDWGRDAGLIVRIADPDPGAAGAGLTAWLAAGCHGSMDYMARQTDLRLRPELLVPGTRSVIVARLDYLPEATAASQVLEDPNLGYISRYALGRDYHKVFRRRLQILADRIDSEVGPSCLRVFTDSAPVMEVDLATRAGLGWRGKHTLLLSRTGSWFFLGEIFCSLPLPADPPVGSHCGTCNACIAACPTGAIVAPRRLDARRCISYLTIEHRGSIPEDLRPAMGNRIYGCDDCQLVCPWNRHAVPVGDPAFGVRHGLDAASLVELFAWSGEEFEQRLAGSPIRRIGFERWLRNIAVALGNAPTTSAALAALQGRRDDPSALVREHVAWALARHESGSALGSSGSAHHSLHEPG